MTEPYIYMGWSILGDLHGGDRSPVITESTHLNSSLHEWKEHLSWEYKTYKIQKIKGFYCYTSLPSPERDIAAVTNLGEQRQKNYEASRYSQKQDKIWLRDKLLPVYNMTWGSHVVNWQKLVSESNFVLFLRISICFIVTNRMRNLYLQKKYPSLLTWIEKVSRQFTIHEHTH